MHTILRTAYAAWKFTLYALPFAILGVLISWLNGDVGGLVLMGGFYSVFFGPAVAHHAWHDFGD